jgi:predicted RNase H-like HicB family nuclease
MKNEINAIIEKGKDGFYSIYIPSISGLYGTGKTETEAKDALNDAVEMALEYAEEKGVWGEYEPLSKEFAFKYSYDLSGFFKTFDVFDVSAFASYVGINSSLMRCYKQGIKKASASQKTKILQGINRLVKQLSAATF